MIKNAEYRYEPSSGAYTIFLLHWILNLSQHVKLSSKTFYNYSLLFYLAISIAVLSSLFFWLRSAPLINKYLTTYFLF